MPHVLVGSTSCGDLPDADDTRSCTYSPHRFPQISSPLLKEYGESKGTPWSKVVQAARVKADAGAIIALFGEQEKRHKKAAKKKPTSSAGGQASQFSAFAARAGGPLVVSKNTTSIEAAMTSVNKPRETRGAHRTDVTAEEDFVYGGDGASGRRRTTGSIGSIGSSSSSSTHINQPPRSTSRTKNQKDLLAGLGEVLGSYHSQAVVRGRQWAGPVLFFSFDSDSGVLVHPNTGHLQTDVGEAGRQGRRRRGGRWRGAAAVRGGAAQAAA